jgi:hypothetical protein
MWHELRRAGEAVLADDGSFELAREGALSLITAKAHVQQPV